MPKKKPFAEHDLRVTLQRAGNLCLMRSLQEFGNTPITICCYSIAISGSSLYVSAQGHEFYNCLKPDMQNPSVLLALLDK